tara:strand:+ start:183 stop:896 length:714 start_codon:yes stop_codon:yes gene_type:complete
MRYELKKNSKGMITQCETNADGGNIYARRKEINKLALENLERPTPGKLGNLSNLQVFNFRLSDISPSTSSPLIRQFYNTNISFPANATQVIMFGVNGLNNKALYYNILDIKANVLSSSSSNANLQVSDDSYLQFYLLQNIETSTTSLGTKIPQPAPLYGNMGGSLNISTDGDINGHQAVSTNVNSDSVMVPSNVNGARASGLALKSIYINFEQNEDVSDVAIDVIVYVDVSSVSSTY